MGAGHGVWRLGSGESADERGLNGCAPQIVMCGLVVRAWAACVVVDVRRVWMRERVRWGGGGLLLGGEHAVHVDRWIISP